MVLQCMVDLSKLQVYVRARQMATLVVVAESGGCSDKVARRAVLRHLYFDILNKIKMSDLEARISDIYHVISCISHFLWILYIKMLS